MYSIVFHQVAQNDFLKHIFSQEKMPLNVVLLTLLLHAIYSTYPLCNFKQQPAIHRKINTLMQG